MAFHSAGPVVEQDEDCRLSRCVASVSCACLTSVQKERVLSTSVAAMSSALHDIVSRSSNAQFRHSCLTMLQVIIRQLQTSRPVL